MPTKLATVLNVLEDVKKHPTKYREVEDEEYGFYNENYDNYITLYSEDCKLILEEFERLRRENVRLHELNQHYYSYASDQEGKYVMAKGVIDWLKIWLEDIQNEEFDIKGHKGMCTDIRIDFLLNKIKELEENFGQQNQFDMSGVFIKQGDYINGNKISKITKDVFRKGQIDLFTDKEIIEDFGDRTVIGYRITRGDKNGK